MAVVPGPPYGAQKQCSPGHGRSKPGLVGIGRRGSSFCPRDGEMPTRLTP